MEIVKTNRLALG